TIYGDVQKGALSFSKTPFKGQSAIEPEPETDQKKVHREKTKSTTQQEKDLEALERATRDVQDAVEKAKGDK
ncbi:MAG TPA: hypothetical protein PKD70_04190, partial [Saprospiraceae bacterium]|nr:hypothetical protein [Saprospiraceae bacterium]